MIENTTSFCEKLEKEISEFGEMYSIFSLLSMENFLTHSLKNFIPQKTEICNISPNHSSLFPTSRKITSIPNQFPTFFYKTHLSDTFDPQEHS